MRYAWLPLFLNLVGLLLSVGGCILRLNHRISFGLAFALLTAGILAISQARRLKKRPAQR